MRGLKFNVIFVMLLVFVGLAAAQATGSAGLMSAIGNLCKLVSTLLPTVALLMIIAAGVLYAAGQFMGAETRARASVWATAMLTGAVIAVLIAVIAPWLLKLVWGTGGTTFATTC
ncbi:hypothetical protein COT30_03780 [Candidatus Micrarchaeota archaeon CG08_land_8_20_14_0_20_49_17]|nr:MAG: hypothetical protein AUJ13_00865 [Candidatus Micrarchaeota archaeon CG1_02_49_24]PIU09540.1 MAG: hypothetical protein COT30_03780 [Candidatus Micrarchaeota archaeon CG08_land_8_20_14_0_20_49_17]HII53201.1 hypothetical protein [Candidatus Micrarchaeota archaeon]